VLRLSVEVHRLPDEFGVGRTAFILIINTFFIHFLPTFIVFSLKLSEYQTHLQLNIIHTFEKRPIQLI
jgi:hypothetical protein